MKILSKNTLFPFSDGSKRLPALLLTLLLSGLLASTQVMAKPPTFEHLAADQIGELLGRLDQASISKKSPSGSHYYVLTFGKTKVVLRGLLCKTGKCRMLRLSAVFQTSKPSLEAVNSWNAGHRYSRAYIDSDGDIMLVSDLDLDGGINDHDAMMFVEVFGDQASDFMDVLQ